MVVIGCLGFVWIAYYFAAYRTNYLGQEYRGRKLAEWAYDLSFPSESTKNEAFAEPDAKRQAAAVEAIQHYGTNALPFALRLIRTENSTLELKLMNWVGDFNLRQNKFYLDHGISYAQNKWVTGLEIFNVLGSNAAPAIPTLIGYLGEISSSAANNATIALHHIGPSAIPELLILLTNENNSAANLAAFCLGQYGTNAVSAVPSLLKRLDDRNETVRQSAAHALAKISDDSNLLIPVFIKYLENRQNRPHPDVFMKLRAFGLIATQAIPVLIHRIESKTSKLEARNALMALEKINPEIAQYYMEKFNQELKDSGTSP
jgi:hypothetical protein